MNNSSRSFDRYANLKKNFQPSNKAGTAGQIVNDIPEHKTLSDYIRSVKRADAFDAVAAEKKLTFDEWANKQWPNGFENYEGNLGLDDLLGAWMFAIRNGKV